MSSSEEYLSPASELFSSQGSQDRDHHYHHVYYQDPRFPSQQFLFQQHPLSPDPPSQYPPATTSEYIDYFHSTDYSHVHPRLQHPLPRGTQARGHPPSYPYPGSSGYQQPGAPPLEHPYIELPPPGGSHSLHSFGPDRPRRAPPSDPPYPTRTSSQDFRPPMQLSQPLASSLPHSARSRSSTDPLGRLRSPEPYSSFANLIADIIIHHPRQKLTIQELYIILKAQYGDYFPEHNDNKPATMGKRWRATVRHALSVKEWFRQQYRTSADAKFDEIDLYRDQPPPIDEDSDSDGNVPIAPSTRYNLPKELQRPSKGGYWFIRKKFQNEVAEAVEKDKAVFR